VLAWVFERCDDEGGAEQTPIGLVPAEGALETAGLGLSAEDMEKLLSVDTDEWIAQLPQLKEHYAMFGERLPPELREQLHALETRLRAES
jgi:phosphoenolpyruvate carboxykinase (GTP)